MSDASTRNALAAFVARANGANHEDPEVYRQLVRSGVRLLEVRPREIARAFCVSQPLARRWLDGTTLPERILRPRIVNMFLVRARAQIGATATDATTANVAARAGEPSEP